MKFTGMDHFQDVCKQELVRYYNEHLKHLLRGWPPLTIDDVFVVWSCKTLQNYKCLVATTVNGDGIYAEYTFNGDKGELYQDVYKKLSNKCFTE